VVAILEGRHDEGRVAFTEAVRRWRDLGLEFESAMCALTLVTMMGVTDGEARDAADQARIFFERVGANPHVALLDQAIGAVPPARSTRGGAPAVGEVPASATRADH
jgi:hypothetical protein